METKGESFKINNIYRVFWFNVFVSRIFISFPRINISPTHWLLNDYIYTVNENDVNKRETWKTRIDKFQQLFFLSVCVYVYRSCLQKVTSTLLNEHGARSWLIDLYIQSFELLRPFHIVLSEEVVSYTIKLIYVYSHLLIL